MALIRVVGVLALVVACDKGKVEPAKGSAQPTPAPLPVPDPAPMPVDAAVPAPPSGVWVRACNDTGKTMDALQWHDTPYWAHFLKKGECTFYEQVSHSYSYTFAKFNLGKDELIIQPIDYMGEKQLDPGLYSFHIKIVDYGHRQADIRAKLDSTATKVEVRECNDTSFDFTLSQVGELRTQLDTNGRLKAHTCTPYIEQPKARMVSSWQFTIGKDENFFSGTTDAIGRTLNPGKWSYRLSIADGRDHEGRIIVKQDPW
jgi:hypothetical protein